jgi:thioredoxin-related protein
MIFWHNIGPRLIAFVCVLCFTVSAQSAQTRDAMTHFFDANTGDLKAELAEAKAAGKKAILFMYEQEGCPSCLYMKQHVLNRVDVQQIYRRHFVNFTLDIHGAVPLKDFAGRDITEKAFSAAAKVRGTPTFVFHDMSGAEIARVVGAVRDIDEFKMLAEFIAGGTYKIRTFAEHKQLQKRKKSS